MEVNGGKSFQMQIIFIIIHQIFSLTRDWSKRVTWANIPQLKLGNIRGYSPVLVEAHSFPRASLSENCSLLGTDNVRGQISEHIFAPNEGYCLYIYPPRICLHFKLVPIQYREYQYGLLPWTARVITYWLRFIFAVHFGIQFKTRRKANAPNDRFAICSVISSLSSSVEIWFFRLVWYLIISMQKFHHADWLRACQLIPNSSGLRVNSPWGEAAWAIDPWPLRAKGLIILASPN